ncbi:succinate-semialdehyde dehydrogenase / glutarate-semialdehyde dehydrogenase [Geosmithia morbida]|uniref:Succinate-semialdehyde dehydrogenase, mitochondrial n=1 Tax=Geosmithia morbida TaxID=1094350 RepID=A0A9P4Z1V3_9HYPO|nr:succinate-semialdehyde dehydrogenase / glutarate-semialdehyde dehydrogenase [Geosmithia morbida]KAF4125114.1 succinate-semialdehyde dehydrogenase / glutarate-semialdehyde dehydrogenase [Geosmithia morbida]
MAPQLKDPSLLKQNVCFVNGEWKAAKSGKTFEVTDPGTGKLVGTSPEFTAEDTQEAIDAASVALSSFRKLTGRERARLLRRWYDELVANAEDIATLITWENGKPLADARGEATYAANFYEWFSEEAPRIYGDTIGTATASNRVVTYREPIGVCGFITPWNFPAAMITRKVGPALAAGCTVVCKAPGETPFTALAIAELGVRAGIPKGVFNVVTALNNTIEVGQTLTSAPAIRKVSFTGSTGVGKVLMKQSADTLKKLSMELGGNAPLIVFDDAELDVAVAGAITSKFRSSGQTCVCANRIYVQKGIYDEFVARFAAKVREFKVGNGFDEGTTHGPLIHSRAIEKVDAHVRDAVTKGATVLVGGQKLPNLGSNFFQPTVIRDMTSDMDIASQETFGPVAGIFPFSSEQEVVSLANKAEVGLAGYFFSRDIERVYRVAEALEVGMVGVNTGLISDTAAPFGGVKQSGFGREGSKYGIEEYQIIKTITFGGMGKPLQIRFPPSYRPLAMAAIAAPIRTFSASTALYKKRKIAPASNSPNNNNGGSSSKAMYSPTKVDGGSSNGGAQPDPEDPLNFSAVTEAYAPIDAHFKSQLHSLLNGGRFNPDSLGGLQVSVKTQVPADDGTGAVLTDVETFPLRELCQVVPRPGRTISLLVNERDYVKPIMSAVQASPDFNQQPQRSDDNDLELVLRVQMERKEDLIRRLRDATQTWRDRVRHARTKHDKVLKEWKKNKVLTTDVARKAETELQKLQNKKMKEIDDEEARAMKQLERNSS